MLINLYNQLFIMSIVVGGLYLILRLISVVTMKYFTVVWHYYSYTSIYLFLLLPYQKLIALFHLTFSQKSGNNFVFPTLPFSIRIQTSDINELVSIDVKTGIDLLLNSLFFYLLIAGTLIFLLIVFFQNYKLHHSIFDGCSLTDEIQTLQILSNCKQKMRISKKMLIYIAPYATTPFLYGVFNPRIVLPEAEFTAEELECIFYHELMHWKRHDAWLKCLILLANAIHWYNPLAYIARSDIERLCELSCDESIALSMNYEERGQYCELLLGVLQHVATQHAKLYSAFSDKKQLERRINVIMKIGDLKNKKLVRLLAVTMTLTFLFGGAATAYAVSGNPNQSSDEDALIIGGDSVFSGDVNEVTLENEYVSILDSDVILLEGESIIITSMASGDLGAGKSYSYDKQYLAKGKKVTINAEWAPTESDLKIGLKSSSGNIAAKTVSDGYGSVTYEINTSGDYYIYIGNPSKSAVKFDVSYIVN